MYPPDETTAERIHRVWGRPIERHLSSSLLVRADLVALLSIVIAGLLIFASATNVVR